jgi:hypothetical protein
MNAKHILSHAAPPFQTSIALKFSLWLPLPLMIGTTCATQIAVLISGWLEQGICNSHAKWVYPHWNWRICQHCCG